MLSRYFDFEGRIGRMQYFVNMVVSTALGAVLCGLVALLLVLLFQVAPGTSIALGILALIGYLWATCHFSFSQTAKRAHDLGHSGWVSLLVFVPVFGFLVTLYFYFAPGEEHANAYGCAIAAD
jgi:uncharacterized membrane protein YhaH (DUF805 family)